MAKQTKKPGRPPIGDRAMASPLAIRLREDQLEFIEQVIADHPHLNDRNSVIRDLVDRGAEDLLAEIKLLAGRKQ